MLTFEVHRNGQKLCTAGVGDEGMVSVIALWRSGEPAAGESLELSVGGLTTREPDSQLTWARVPLQVGDQVAIKVGDSDTADPPQLSARPRPTDVLRSKQEYVREMAKEWGWTVTEASASA